MQHYKTDIHIKALGQQGTSVAIAKKFNELVYLHYKLLNFSWSYDYKIKSGTIYILLFDFN